jgi:hypothetical protein
VAANPSLTAEEVAERLRIDAELAELAEAQTSFAALRAHLEENKYFYHRSIWSRYDYTWIAERLRDFGLPPALFELRFAAFEGEHGAIRLANLDLAGRLGFDADGLSGWAADLTKTDTAPWIQTTTIPTAGVVVEPLLATCPGGDDFVVGHRALDLERAAAEIRRLNGIAAYAEAEAQRAQQRLAAGQLDDPRPFAGVDQLELDTADTDD